MYPARYGFECWMISVFSKIFSYDSEENDSSLVAKIYSGTISEEGIINYYDCLVMVDDFGDPNDHYISIGDARIFYDSDSIAEKTTAKKSLQVPEEKILPLFTEDTDPGSW